MPSAAVVMVLVLGIAFWLRTYLLGDANIWWDEGWSVWLARFSLPEIANRTALDDHPPLHYWFLSLWDRGAGEAEFAVRYSSALAGVISVALMYAAGRAFLGAWYGLWAAGLLAASRFHVSWSQQVKMYSLAFLLALLALTFVFRLLRRDSKRDWVGYILSVTLLLHTHYLGILLPGLVTAGVITAAILGPDRSVRIRWIIGRWLPAHAAIGVLLLPWLKLVGGGDRPIPMPTNVVDAMTFVRAVATSYALGVSTNLDRYTIPTVVFLVLLVPGLVLLLSNRTYRCHGLILGLLLTLPPFLIAVFSLPTLWGVPNPVYFSPNLFVRYAVIFLPAAYLPAAATILWLWRWSSFGKAASAASVLLSVGIAAWSLAEYYPARVLTEDLQRISSYIEDYASPEDAVVLFPDRHWPIFQYYYTDPLPIYGFDTWSKLDRGRVEEVLSEAFLQHPRVWLVQFGEAPGLDPAGYVSTWLGKRAQAVQQLRVGNKQLTLYRRGKGPVPAVATRTTRGIRRDLDLAPGIRLVSVDGPLRRVQAGDNLYLSAYWQLPMALIDAADVDLRVIDRLGRPVAAVVLPLADQADPRSQTDRVLRGDYVVPIPADTYPGGYSLQLGVRLPDYRLGREDVKLTPVQVLAAPRQ